MRALLVGLAGLIGAAVAAPLSAQSSPSEPAVLTAIPDFADWIGDWSGEGIVFDQLSRATVRFAPSLDGNAMVQDYALTIAGSRPQKFWGHGAYRIDAKGVITGQWTDSAGSLHDLKGRLASGSWSIHWGSPLTEIGRTVHRMEPNGIMVITDSTLQSDGSWRQFAQMRYTRAVK